MGAVDSYFERIWAFLSQGLVIISIFVQLSVLCIVLNQKSALII